MSTSPATTAVSPPRRQPWIISAWWDLAYVVVTPVAIVPVVLILARHWLTAEQVSLAVISFASLGHHLPGFMRAYGDRELFHRFRWRFLLSPLLVFALALLFTPPPPLASALHLPWKHLHGLELILLFWGTWHGLMQIYGFMRIYDVRLGVNDRRSGQLDHALCLIVFVAGVVFSDARVFSIAKGMWQSGLPLFGPEWLYWTRVAVGVAAVGILSAYAMNLRARWRKGQPVSLLKLLLVGTTGWFYWFTGRLSTNVLIGLAMFEIYHAVQYYAIVWIYNRRLLRRAGDRFGLLGFLFRDRWSMLGFYLAAIAAYGSIRFFADSSNGLLFLVGSAESHQWLMALFVSSSLLHFYFDGFIWKVSERKTQENLVDEVVQSSPLVHYVPGLLHAGKWALLLLIAGGLLYSEWLDRDQWNTIESKRVLALAALTPKLPECQVLLCQEAMSRNDPSSAIQHAERALALRPRSHSIRAELAVALMQAGRLDEAQAQLEQAIAIGSKRWRYHCELGLLLARQGDVQQAEQEYRRAVELRPELEKPQHHLAEFYLRQGRTADAQRQLDAIVKLFPGSRTAEINQVFVLSQQGQHDDATRLATSLVADNPEDWRVQLALGAALNSSGASERALEPLLNAIAMQSRSAEVHYQFGLAVFQTGRPESAIAPLQQAFRLDPYHFRACLQLGNS
ncbi:MAG: tetratricopeptide repeat protein, partial [Thermoguttaceae bacterium]